MPTVPHSSRARITVALLLCLVLGTVACTARRSGQSRGDRPQPPPLSSDVSGFLDDYSRLRPGGRDEVRMVYRNPEADWRRYHAIMLEPVTIWRSGKQSLDPVPMDDLLRLAHDFEGAVRSRLGRSYQLVDRPGPGVLRVRLGITEARASDAVLDVLTVPPGEEPAGAESGHIDRETRRFIDRAMIEGELLDAETGVVLAQGVDGPRRPDAPPLDTWVDIDRGFARWADRVVARLEARTGAKSAAQPGAGTSGRKKGRR